MVKRRGDPKTYRHWVQWVTAWQPKLPPGFDLAVLKAIALFIGNSGNFGVQCFIGDTAVGKIVGRDRDTVARYRGYGRARCVHGDW